jgi:ribose 5-phosphate isomerase B
MNTNLTFNMQLPIAIGSDHAGFDYKLQLIPLLEAQGFTVKDFGTHSNASVDYPDFAHPVAEGVESEAYAFGILLCGSANGVAITANKHQSIRAAICWLPEIATLARLHNNANIVCIPARFISVELCNQIVMEFMQTNFEGGRHQNRVSKIACTV